MYLCCDARAITRYTFQIAGENEQQSFRVWMKFLKSEKIITTRKKQIPCRCGFNRKLLSTFSQTFF